MAEFPALPLWTDAYLGDTTHLTTIEHGAYLLLLMAMWRSDGVLPNDDAKLARYARLTGGQWARIKPTIMEFFRVEGGRISQGRLTDELNAVRRNSRKQSDKAKARWLKNNETSDAAAMPERCRSDAPLPLPLPLPLKEEREEDPRSSSSSPSSQPEQTMPMQQVDPDLRQRVMAACGAPEHPCSSRWMPPAASIHVRRWVTDLGLTEPEILDVARAERQRHSGADPPAGPKALDRAMKALAAEKAAPPMQPAIPRIANGNQSHHHADAAIDRAIDDLRAGRIDSIVAGPFAPGASRRR